MKVIFIDKEEDDVILLTLNNSNNIPRSNEYIKINNEEYTVVYVQHNFNIEKITIFLNKL